MFSFNKPASSTASDRAARYSQRCSDSSCHEEQSNDSDENPLERTTLSLGEDFDVSEVVIDQESDVSSAEEEATAMDATTQCALLANWNGKWSHQMFKDNNAALHYYTSFDDYDHFLLFFTCLGPATSELKKFISLPDPINQLLITLMKLRRRKDDFELAFLFKISSTTVGEIVNLWINFMYFQLKELNLWPDGEVIESHMPKSFGKMFGNTKIILDATETPIDKPEHVEAQSMSFSTYKNTNTLKTMVGCSPRCVTTYVSDSYAGSVSDRQIIERSKLVTDYPFKEKDQVLADRGIMVQDLFATKDVQVVTPHTLKGKHQLDAVTLVKDRRVASKRIHIERVIGLGKTFLILKSPLNSQRLPLANRIIFICLMINNFRKCIVSRYA